MFPLCLELVLGIADEFLKCRLPATLVAKHPIALKIIQFALKDRCPDGQ